MTLVTKDQVSSEIDNLLADWIDRLVAITVPMGNAMEMRSELVAEATTQAELHMIALHTPTDDRGIWCSTCGFELWPCDELLKVGTR